MKNIYFGIKNKDPYIKVIDSKLFPTTNNIDCIIKKNDEIDDIFLAP